jgi:hypothetical protein
LAKDSWGHCFTYASLQFWAKEKEVKRKEVAWMVGIV